MTTTRIAHIGGPTALIDVGEWRLLTDPTFDPPGPPLHLRLGLQLPEADRPGGRRHRPRPDRCGAAQPRPPRRQPRRHRARPAAGGRRRPHHAPGARRLGGNARGLQPWATTRLEGPGRPAIQVTATPCRHGPPLIRPITGPVRYSMTAREAVELCHLIRPRTAIPVHYEGWTHFRQGRGAIEHEFEQAPADIGRRLQWLPIGASTTVSGSAHES